MSALWRKLRLRRWRASHEMPVVTAAEHLALNEDEGQIVRCPAYERPTLYRIKNVLAHSIPVILLLNGNNRPTILAESVNYNHLQEAIDKAFRRSPMQPPRSLSGDWMVLDSHWANNLWHWVFEQLPKLVLAEASGFTGCYLIPDGGHFVLQSMKLMGIESSRMKVSDGSTYHIESLHITERLEGKELFARCPSIGDAVRDQLLSASPQGIGGERIYIARRKGRRALTNEAEVDELAARHGFRKVYMEDFELAEQIGIMRSCRALLAPHGAGMTHVLFMPPGSLVLELFSPAYINPTMLSVIDRFRHRYFMIPSYWNSPDRSLKPYVHGLDMEAFLEVIALTLKRELETSSKIDNHYEAKNRA